MRRSLFCFVVIIYAVANLPVTGTPRLNPQTKTISSHDARIITAVRAVLDGQVAAWNRGDIDGFMEGYARSPDTVFVSGDSVTHGWQTVLDHYKKGYDSREKMGTLTFADLAITPMGDDVAVVLGSWRLKRANDEPHGRFTLIFRKTKQHGWKIVHDHTSTAT